MEAELADVARRLPAARLDPVSNARLAEALSMLAARRQGVRLAAAFQRDGRHLTAALARDLRPLFTKLGEHVATVAGQVGALAVEADVPTDDERARVDRITAAARLGDWATTELVPVFEQHMQRVADRSVETINAQVDLEVMIPDPVANRLIAEGGRRAGLVDIDGDTRRALFRTLAQAREDGLGPPATARLIRNEVPAGRFVNAGPRYRAELIARTETLHAQRFSTLEVYKGADTVHSVIAHDALGGDTDRECELRDGRVMTFDAADHAMNATHPNCTLNFSPLVRD